MLPGAIHPSRQRRVLRHQVLQLKIHWCRQQCRFAQPLGGEAIK